MRFHAVSISDEYPEGKKPYTEAEETERDAEEAAHIAGADGREAEKVRTDRNSRLAKTDFHALSDTDMSEAMTTYRQALRDIPQQAEFPNTITWPTEPN
jgi:hypothetical protein